MRPRADRPEAPGRGAWREGARWLAVGVLLTAFAVGGRALAASVPRLVEWVGAQGAAGVAAFVLAYAVGTVLLVPGSLLTLAAGALFGLARGTLVALVAATLGSTAAFVAGRFVVRELVARRLARDPRLAAIAAAVSRDGLRITLLLRLSPLVPFNVLNYALALTTVRLRDFLLGSVGMLPGTALYVYAGTLAGSAAAAAGGAPLPPAGRAALLVAGFVATVLATLLVTRAARRALGEVMGRADG